MNVINSSILYNLTLKENIDDIDFEKLDKIIKVCCADFCFDLGLDYIVGVNGQKLSGGQAQRICLARVLYLNPSFYVFDEISSALDYGTANQIFANLIDYTKDKIVFFISHQQYEVLDEMKNFKTVNLVK